MPVAEQIPLEESHPPGKQTGFVLRSRKQSMPERSEPRAGSSPALLLQGWWRILRSGPRLGACALGTQRGDGTATPPCPEAGARDAPRSAGSREMCLPFPCAPHVSGQRTKPPKAPRVGRASPGACCSLLAAHPSRACGVRARGGVGPQLGTRAGNERGPQGWLHSRALRRRSLVARGRRSSVGTSRESGDT